MSRPKKARLDFGAMVAGCEGVRSNAHILQQKAKEFTTAVSAAINLGVIDSLARICGMCDDETVQLVLVSRLGLEGLDSLRSAIQAVPEAFLSKRASFVVKVVNSVLQGSNKQCITEAECEIFMSLCLGKCKAYLQRKAHPLAFENELTELTAMTGTGYNGFLAPPVMYCLNVSCERRKLATYHEPTNVTLFTIDGPRPASKISLKCSKCCTNYSYSTYGNKLLSGVRYYDQEPDFVEASDVVYLDRNLYQLFASLRYYDDNFYVFKCIQCLYYRECRRVLDLLWHLSH